MGVRFYSLHREYGITPDPVPTPQDRPMVLIGPPDNAPAQSASPDGAGGDDEDGATSSDSSSGAPASHSAGGQGAN